MPFKRKHWPSLDEREYRISQGHDAAAALVVDGRVIAAAAEERFNREKHSARFPLRAIDYCLSEAGLALEDVDELAHGFDHEPFQQLFSLDADAAELYREVYCREALLRLVERDLPRLSCGPRPITSAITSRTRAVRISRPGSMNAWSSGSTEWVKSSAPPSIERSARAARRSFTRFQRLIRSGSCTHS